MIQDFPKVKILLDDVEKTFEDFFLWKNWSFIKVQKATILFLILSDLFAGLHAWFVKEVSVVTLKTAKLCKFYIWRTLLKKSHTRAARPTDGRNRVEGEREDQSWRFSWKDFARDQSRDWESFIFAEPRSQDRSLCNSVKMVPGGQSEFNLLLGTPGPESPGSGWGIIVATDWS